MKATRRHYSDEERANALAALKANGGNVKRTALQLGIPHKTLDNWAKGVNHPGAAELGNRKTADMAAALEDVAWKLLDAIPGKVEKAPLNHTATALGIAIDKARLLRGEPTSIGAKVDLSRANPEQLAQLDALLAVIVGPGLPAPGHLLAAGPAEGECLPAGGVEPGVPAAALPGGDGAGDGPPVA